jgi:hypothetical protein
MGPPHHTMILLNFHTSPRPTSVPPIYYLVPTTMLMSCPFKKIETKIDLKLLLNLQEMFITNI